MKKVDAAYYSDRADELFREAREIFPQYNWRQASDAADWIFERLVTPAMTDEEQAELYEEIYGGLT